MNNIEKKRLKEIPEVLGEDWIRLEKIAAEINVKKNLVRSVLNWLRARKDEYCKKYETNADSELIHFYKRDISKKGGLFEY